MNEIGIFGVSLAIGYKNWGRLERLILGPPLLSEYGSHECASFYIFPLVSQCIIFRSLSFVLKLKFDRFEYSAAYIVRCNESVQDYSILICDIIFLTINYFSSSTNY